MKKFLILNQDQEPVVNTRWNEFTCGISELASVYIVHIVTTYDGHSYSVAVYHDIKEAAEAVVELKNFAFAVNEENRGFALPVSEAPVTALEIVDLLS